MTVVLTRPILESETLSRGLAAHEIDSIVAPMLSIVAREQPDLEAELDRAQAVLLTSANGARALAEATGRRDVPLFVVGDATAATARAEGFAEVESADGDSTALAALIGDRLTPDAGALLHISGGHVAGDLEGALADSGFLYQRCILYDAVAAEAMPESLVNALKAGTVDGVLLFSPRSARTFVHLARQSDVAPALKQVTAYCLSDAVAAVAERELWRQAIVSARPRTDSLIERVVSDMAPGPTKRIHSGPAAAIPEPTGHKTVGTRTWPTIATSIAASAVVAVIIVLALGTSPVGDNGAGVPVDLEARLQALDAGGNSLADRLEVLEARARSLAELDDRVAAAEARLAVMAASADGAVGDADLAELAGDVEMARSELAQELTQEIDRVAQALDVDIRALSDAVDGLTERVGRVGARDAGAAGTLLLAVGQLRAAALGSGPFADEIEAVRAVAAGDPEVAHSLATMAPWASDGVATDEMLRAGFQGAALAILRADSLPEDAGWLDTAYAEVKGLVTVRRVGEDVEGDDPQARLARAEARLVRGDLVGAIELVEAIDGADTTAGDWLAAARGRSAVSAALDELASMALIRAGTATPRR